LIVLRNLQRGKSAVDLLVPLARLGGTQSSFPDRMLDRIRKL